MEAKIKEEIGSRQPKDVNDLYIDNCDAPQIAGLTSDFVNLETIYIQSGLTSLKGFPSLPNLRRIEFSQNKLSGGFENITGCKMVYTINLSGNPITNYDCLKPLKELPELSKLYLFECPISEQENYREKVFEMIPQLQYLDGIDRKGEEDLDDEDFDDEEDAGYDVNGEDEEEEENEEDEDEGEDSEDIDEEDEEDEEENGNVNDSRGTKRKHEEEAGDEDDDDEDDE